ncbi:uncharacterized protein NDAI_0H01220 [Naumovozyma dairenensis CBS 421]|uniref:Uncharacterized protein n=1 Tax=Naumovozyma dairenensis (strain ATCC 10597 / BCRC 20456 / CBS 421 / NBRC 0211 / NRRL Y-12639) TaxID=1071378 RepID=G0WET5_NAUDC|nr:hypothetical protein NDAI_0H01220 [Naumovozyma dairenensis CBS 421]CCD26296.1 hypothetical protein NDAI_0H01220 [Naumovozyma dairenensis CBS 421]
MRRHQVYKLSIVIILCTVLVLKLTNNLPIEQIGHHYYALKNSRNQIKSKKDFLNVDISNLLKFKKNWINSPIRSITRTQEYSKKSLVGYVSNLDLKDEKKGSEYSASCSDLEYINDIEYSYWVHTLPSDLKEVRRELLTSPAFEFVEPQLHSDLEINWDEEKILEKNWLTFGGVSVWSKRYNVYFVYSRVIYSRKAQRNHPHVSLVRGQVFDKDWNEIHGFKVPFNDIIVPKDDEVELQKLDEDLGLYDCKKQLGHKEKELASNEYENCLVEVNKLKLKNEKRKKEILQKYYTIYPTVLNIPFISTGADYEGPEDPHIIMRETAEFEEPLIFFNMQDHNDGKRKLYGFLPHQKSDPLIEFHINGRGIKGKEKNWVPFFHADSSKGQAESQFSRGTIHFIYSFYPLEILKCSLNDGDCEFVFEGSTLELDKDTEFSGMRGSTQFINLPNVIPTLAGKQLWVGFPKFHLNGCGCGVKYYRPMLSVIVESNGVYHQELVVPTLDFNIDVLSWDLKGHYCFDVNVLNPNSINYWEVVSQDPVTKKYEDYMSLTVSEADHNTKVVIVKGLLNYILGIYKDKNIKEDFQITEHANSIIAESVKCIDKDTKQDCKNYGKTHPEPKDL